MKMEANTANSPGAASTATTMTLSVNTNTTTTSASVAQSTNTSANASSSTASAGSGSLALVAATCLPAAVHMQQTPLSQLLTTAIEATRQEDVNNLSMASGLSEGQRSHSGAASASSSPILSPQGKIFGRNANGTMVATSRPNNEAEIQLYRVLQRASLLAYYDTLLEMGGDDVQQLYDAGEEEFLEIMALVGMASKPLHVRRLQKALHEWANNPALFQGPMLPNTSGLCETPPKSSLSFSTETTPAQTRYKQFHTFTGSAAFHPTPLINTTHTSPASTCATSTSAQLLTQICTPAITVPVIQPHTPLLLPNPHSHTQPSPINNPNSLHAGVAVQANVSASGSTSHQVTSSSPQLTPVLTEMQVQRITLGAEKIARQLPQREPRAQTSKKRTTRELEQVIAMSENDPRRMDEIRKYSAIYGRFDCKRRPEKPLTLHEVCVNEAAAQLCRLVPALLTRRDELFPLARQIVKDAGFGHSASIARYGGLLSQMQTQSTQRSSVALDCESSDATAVPTKRQRLCSTESPSAPVELNREAIEDSRYNLFAMYQKFAKPPFDLSEIAKFSMGKSEFDDNMDNDSRFSFSNSSSPPMPVIGTESELDSGANRNAVGDEANSLTMKPSSNSSTSSQHQQQQQQQRSQAHSCCNSTDVIDISETMDLRTSSPLSGVQVISAAGGNIIAVANPALALSPTLNDVLTLKRDVKSPEA